MNVMICEGFTGSLSLHDSPFHGQAVLVGLLHFTNPERAIGCVVGRQHHFRFAVVKRETSRTGRVTVTADLSSCGGPA